MIMRMIYPGRLRKISGKGVWRRINVGTKIRLPETRCRDIIEEVSDGCRELSRYRITLD